MRIDLKTRQRFALREQKDQKNGDSWRIG